MPTIAELVKKNEQRLEGLKGNPTQAPQPLAPPVGAAPAPPAFLPTTELPLRSTFPPVIYSADQVSSGSQPARPAQRSAVWQATDQVSNDQTPVTLTNKKLLRPIIGGGTSLNRYNKVTATLTPKAVGGGASATQTFAVAGVQAADKLAGYQWGMAQTAGVTTLAVRVVAANKIAVDFYNPTGGSLTPTGGSITLFLFQ
jgi:hypothetical protein